MIPIYKPYFTKKSLSYAHDAIDSTWISSHGKYLSMAEEKLKEITNSKYVILTNNGTTATHLVACALNLKHPEIDNLIVPSNVYIAAWNMFRIRPQFFIEPVDSNIQTWNFDRHALEFQTLISKKDEKTGILVVHNLGNIINVPELQKQFPTRVIIEDNCEGFLGSYNGMASGKAALAYSISFFGNKTITSGEGGAFCTDDEAIYNEMNRVRAHGITSEKFIFSGIGYNYRMTNVQAALLYGQLEMVEKIKSMKQEVFDLYKEELQHPLIHFAKKEEGVINPNWMLGIRLDISKELMDKLILHLHSNDVETRPMFPPINYHKHYTNLGKPGEFHISKKLYETVLILPSYPELTKGEIKFICKTIKNFLK